MRLEAIKNHLTKIAIISPILLMLILIIVSIAFINQQQTIIYDTDDIEIVEVRLPSVDLAKYKLLDKIN
jgi:uncharacterized membrane protein